MKQELTIPECWEEMTTAQYQYLLKQVWRMMHDSRISAEDVLRELADYMLGKEKHVREAERIDYWLLVDAAAKRMDWIFEKTEKEVIFNYNSTTVLIPRINAYVGPLSDGGDLLFGEYRKAVSLYNEYSVDHAPEVLDALVGILYRKPAKHVDRSDFDGQYREPYNEHHISDYAYRMRNVPDWIKWGVYQWMSAFCKALISETFVIDGMEICFAPLFESGGSGGDGDESLGLNSVLFSLAESGTFGNVKQTDEAPLFRVLLKMLNDHITAKNLQKK